MKKIVTIKNFLYLLFLGGMVFLGLELLLRIYNPIPVRIKGNKIILPANQKYVFKDLESTKLDKEIIHTKNSLGFRGPEKPEKSEDYLSIITVGGSTTECMLLSDKKTWQSILEENLNNDFKNTWVNNAGLDGHTTFGHQILLENYLIQLQPKMILFLVGANDLETENIGYTDNVNVSGEYTTIWSFLTKNSEVLNLLANFLRNYEAQQKSLFHDYMLLINSNYRHLELSEDFCQAELKKQKPYLDNYEKRLLQLISTCRKNNIEPVIITQPMLYGTEKDSITGFNFNKIYVSETQNGKLYFDKMELYNDVVRKLSNQNGLYTIDLARRLPKNSLYYYDGIHYTNEGAKKIGELIYADIKEYLTKKYPQFKK